MNLELIDPFGRQIPDRIDSTLLLDPALHFRHHEIKTKKKPTEQLGWKAAYHLSFNRRGTYLAIGYGSGTVAVFHTLSRSLAALYQSEDPHVSPTSFGEGVTSVTWSRRSRTLLTGAAGEKTVVIYDTTHPYGPEEACKNLGEVTKDFGDDDAEDGDSPRHKKDSAKGQVLRGHALDKTKNTSFLDADTRYTVVADRQTLTPIILEQGQAVPTTSVKSPEQRYAEAHAHGTSLRKHPSVGFAFAHAAGGSLQVSPRIPTGGLIVLSNGTLMLFWFPPSAFISGDGPAPPVYLVPLYQEAVTCAAFDHHGDRVYAANKEGRLLAFDIGLIWKTLLACTTPGLQHKLPTIRPTLNLSTGGSSAWHVLVSRNGKYLVVNSSDGTLRLYATDDLWSKKTEKPAFSFQDVVSKVKFASCDLSGDGEYVVGGANGGDNKYELYIWNTTTGALMDKLTGASVQLYSVAWHPTRAFLAVATSDGLVDVWGPRINWTAFAPDFQALPRNVEYVEREDEFDVDEKGRFVTETENKEGEEDNENEPVDVMTIVKVPVFASDSESEEEVFYFETKVVNQLAERGKRRISASTED